MNKKKTEKSAFMGWFVQQYGKRPDRRERQTIVTKIQILAQQLLAEKEILTRLDRWELDKSVALKAWIAHEISTSEKG